MIPSPHQIHAGDLFFPVALPDMKTACTWPCRSLLLMYLSDLSFPGAVVVALAVTIMASCVFTGRRRRGAHPFLRSKKMLCVCGAGSYNYCLLLDQIPSPHTHAHAGDLSSFCAAFAALDVDHSGLLSSGELHLRLKQLGTRTTPGELRAMVCALVVPWVVEKRFCSTHRVA